MLHRRLHSAFLLGVFGLFAIQAGYSFADVEKDGTLIAAINQTDGTYVISSAGFKEPLLRSGIAAEVDGAWVQSGRYPSRNIQTSSFNDDVGAGVESTVTFSGLEGKPDLIYHLRVYQAQPLAIVQAVVRNSTKNSIHVNTIRVITASGSSTPNLGDHPDQDRVLSDSYSEDVPAIQIHDLAGIDAGMHRGIGSQLIYNRQSHRSFFVGALTTDRFLTVIRLHVANGTDAASIGEYVVDSTGTTEVTSQNSLRESPAEDRVPLSLEVEPGEDLNSEKLVLMSSTDYHHDLEEYGALIRRTHRPRIQAPNLMGWWSWTAYYYGLTEAAALTNAKWLEQHLKTLGYNYFHLDEGYQFARGEYTTPDATLFPNGIAAFENKVTALGLIPGIWTAPFEASERSMVVREHPDWLVHNAKNEPIQLGWANNHHDRLYVVDTTNPAAQDYLKKTYSTLVHDWGIRYIKLDFMDDSGVEGYRYQANTTAMQAQRIGLEIIRQAVGEDVLLDKDGSTMLNPVGYVDFGRIGQDTGHTFVASKEAAPAIAARYYMNRNFFVSDPDAFTVSTQTIKDHAWNGGKVPLTLNEAKVSIALSAVSGGMFEIGDDLPTLGSNPERLALVENRDLIDMVKLGKASRPVDLMTYSLQDGQPSIFLLKEDARQSILTIFNWTDSPRSHTVDLASLGFSPQSTYAATSILEVNARPAPLAEVSTVSQPAHSVRMYKIVNSGVIGQPSPPRLECPPSTATGQLTNFTARSNTADFAIVDYNWNFGDGVTTPGFSTISHAYTQPGRYKVTLESVGLNGMKQLNSCEVTATGSIPSAFVPEAKTRFKTR